MTFSIDGVSETASSEIFFKRHDVAAAPAAVGGDENPGSLVVDPIPERFRRESAEHDRMDRADASARQHGHGQLRNHRQDRG